MDPKVIEEKLATMMDEIPEIEGLIAFENNGKVICGQTLTELDKKKLTALSIELLKKSSEIASASDKGSASTISLTTEKGYLVIETKSGFSILALLGKEASSSLSLVIRALKTIF
ncbi:MAG: roadblock/LC7 domain-containing protein [Candidatus Odinarchaeota archaeon]